MSLAASVAIVDVISPRAGGRRIGLHWPNDVFAEGGKLAGVLVEVLPDGRHILGVGLNLNGRAADAPPELQPRVATLFDLTAVRYDPTNLLIDLLNRIADCFRQLGADPMTLGGRFDEHCLQRGATLTLYQGQRQFTGCCLGVTVDGGLMLETTAGVQTFFAGTLQPPKAGPLLI